MDDNHETGAPKDYEVVFAGFEEAMKENEKRWNPPRCHCTPMFQDSSDDETWWECKHCGHTKLISTHSCY